VEELFEDVEVALVNCLVVVARVNPAQPWPTEKKMAKGRKEGRKGRVSGEKKR
jgi:hypothetical protein